MKRDKSGRSIELKTKEYLETLPEHHRKTFDYTNTIYTGCKNPITFICPLHGVQTYPRAGKHKLSPYGCKACGKEALYAEKVRQGRVRFFDKFKVKYGNSYDLTNTVYTKNNEKSKFICNTHGECEDYPRCAIKRHPCEICRSEERSFVYRKPIEDVKKQSRDKFGEVFEYDFTDYKNCKDLISIKCLKHGWFKDNLANHLSSQYGCSDCYKESSRPSWNRISAEDNFNTLKDLYGDKYHFFCEDIRRSTDKVRYYCRKHKTLKSTQLKHLKDGYACNQCGDEAGAEKLTGWYTKRNVEKNKEKYTSENNNLYIIHLKDDIYKIGIAKQPFARLCTIRKNSRCQEATISDLYGFTTYECFYLEQNIHKMLKDFRYKWEFPWKGHTEVFKLSEDEIEKVYEVITNHKVD